ncbi:MAG: hypothetical protein GX607_19460 [Myxococcales bacterium]|jgi:hypothetical protein|nr:hypothetical protein [Myxococcales bacterium]
MRLYRVHVSDEASVVARGERVRVWWVQLNDGWVRAAEHPEATIETASSERGDEGCPPGTIWIRHVELQLPAGTLLRCHLSQPSPERLEPIEYLRRGQLGVARARRETLFRVAGNYRLTPVGDPKS